MREDKYPRTLYTNVLLLDGKIENWKTGTTQASSDYYPFKSIWKTERLKEKHIIVDGIYKHSYWSLGDYKVESKEWVVNSSEEWNAVFETYSKKWYSQWEHADDYKLGRAY